MNVITVSAVPGGWVVDHAPARTPLMFLAGGKAEQKARELAQRISGRGHAAATLCRQPATTGVCNTAWTTEYSSIPSAIARLKCQRALSHCPAPWWNVARPK